jgi:hypothetical protein
MYNINHMKVHWFSLILIDVFNLKQFAIIRRVTPIGREV